LALHLKVREVPESIWGRLVEGEDLASLQAHADDEAEWAWPGTASWPPSCALRTRTTT
jgi:hypothetical protein